MLRIDIECNYFEIKKNNAIIWSNWFCSSLEFVKKLGLKLIGYKFGEFYYLANSS